MSEYPRTHAPHGRLRLPVSNEAVCVIRNSSKVAIADAWRTHQQQVRALESGGKKTHRAIGFDYYVEVSRQEEMAFS